jgi:CelD/BcsL family acetyltransferase involved in cellulose biosynthesis
MLEYGIIRSLEEWDELEQEWNDLLAVSTTHVPFLRHEYLRLWWDYRGGGEWDKGTLCIIIARENGNLEGIAPFFLSRNQTGEKALLFIGSIEISDYLDFIVCPKLLDEFLNGLLDFLHKDLTLEWEVIDLYNILNDSPTLSSLPQITPRFGWMSEITQLQPAPYIPLPGDFEAYLAGIDKKQRHEIRRKMRRAEESPVPIRWYVSTDPEKVDGEIEDFLRLMAFDPEKDRFLTPAMRDQMRAVIKCAFETGCLHLAFLEVGGEKAAAYMSFDYLDRLWVYNSGFNPAYISHSPGWVLLGYLLRWANEKKYSEFDFLRGGEEYKYRFGSIDRFVHRIKISRNPD